MSVCGIHGLPKNQNFNDCAGCERDALAQQLAEAEKWKAAVECGWKEATRVIEMQRSKLDEQEKQLAELKQAFNESQDEVVSRGKQLAASQAEVVRLKTVAHGFVDELAVRDNRLAEAVGLLREAATQLEIAGGWELPANIDVFLSGEEK